MLRIHVFEHVRLDLLAAFEHEQRIGPTGNVQIAVGVQITQVARAEPAVGREGRGCLLRQVPVTGEDARAVCQDLTLRGRRSIRLRSRSVDAGDAGVDADLDAGQRLSDTPRL